MQTIKLLNRKMPYIQTYGLKYYHIIVNYYFKTSFKVSNSTYNFETSHSHLDIGIHLKQSIAMKQYFKVIQTSPLFPCTNMLVRVAFFELHNVHFQLIFG